jgi:hypothetical protein
MNVTFTRLASVPLYALAFAVACTTNGASGACDAYFSAAAMCASPQPPASEISREQARFATACANALALPGSSVTESFLNSCASALNAAGCNNANARVALPACQPPAGTLAAGAACNEGAQCESGGCNTFTLNGTGTCGTCDAFLADGAACGFGATGTTGNCKPGSGCSMAGTCAPLTYGAAGATCDGTAALCNAGLYCGTVTNTTGFQMECIELPGEGSPCMGACQAPFACLASKTGSALYTCQTKTLGASGAACQVDADCASGLGCGATTRTCGTVTWVSPGQPCNADLARCLEGGQCTQIGTCPTIIPDGQPCNTADQNSMCDAFAQCTNGTCVADDSSVCK